ncbi:MAG: hypothetical protein QOG96_5189, partial [Pseudonocardiales bacterium]|nr:hypothetical protein [Pseudonocardiales bacterium]
RQQSSPVPVPEQLVDALVDHRVDTLLHVPAAQLAETARPRHPNPRFLAS